jgi:hypothetical protein
MERKYPRPYIFAERCQYRYNLGREDEYQCGNPLTPPARRYCLELHKESGPKQNKAITQKNGEYVKEHRDICKDDEEYRRRRQMEQSRVRHGQTKPMLRAFFDRAESQQEYDPHLRYELYEYALNKLNEIMYLILSPPADLPSAVSIAGMIAQELLEFLEAQKQPFPDDSTIDRLILSTLGLQRDFGEWMSARTFTNIGGKARLVREMSQKLCEPLGFGYGLFVDVEIARTQYFAHIAIPKKRQFFENKARNTLSGAKVFCDMLVERSTGERKQLADFLRFYVDSATVRLAFDAGEQDHIASLIQAVDERATAFAHAYSTEQIVATVQFLNATNQAEYQLQCGDLDCSSAHLKEVEDIFNDNKKMPSNSIESQHRIVSIKTQLALQNNDPEREKCVREYLSVLDRYPCFEYRHVLRELKRCYESQVPDVELLAVKDESLFVGMAFTHILPFVMPIYGAGRCPEEAIPRGYEERMVWKS